MAIPKGWTLETLSSVVIPDGLQTGPFGSQLKASEYATDGVPVIMPKDMKNGRVSTASIARIPEAVAESRLSPHRTQSGDLLFARRGEIGRCALITSQELGWVCGTGCLRARPGRKVHPAFLLHQILDAKATSWLTDMAVGQTMLNLNTQILSELPIALPPLPEQKKIAAVLSSVDAAIEKTEAVIAQLQVVKKAMMEQLLTKGLPGRHTRFKQTDLGVIPEDWEVVSLGSVIDGIDAGWSPQCESRPAANGEWGVLKISSVTWGTFDPTENKKLPDHLVPRPNIAVHAGDVLLSRANTPELVGRTVIVEQTYSNLMLSDKLLRLRINRLVAEPRFINLVLGAPLWRELIQDAATGSSGSMKNLSQEKLRALPIPKPATKEQVAIANIFSAQDAVVRGEQLALDRLRTLKSSLSSSLLSGELRVPTDSVPCPV